MSIWSSRTGGSCLSAIVPVSLNTVPGQLESYLGPSTGLEAIAGERPVAVRERITRNPATAR